MACWRAVWHINVSLTTSRITRHLYRTFTDLPSTSADSKQLLKDTLPDCERLRLLPRSSVQLFVCGLFPWLSAPGT